VVIADNKTAIEWFSARPPNKADPTRTVHTLPIFIVNDASSGRSLCRRILWFALAAASGHTGREGKLVPNSKMLSDRQITEAQRFSANEWVEPLTKRPSSSDSADAAQIRDSE